jgi:hypothetical protein
VKITIQILRDIGLTIVEKIFKVNIHHLDKIESVKVEETLFSALISDKKVGDQLVFNGKTYVITGATSSNGTFHLKGLQTRGRSFINNRAKKLMTEAQFLDLRTNQIFLKEVDTA